MSQHVAKEGSEESSLTVSMGIGRQGGTVGACKHLAEIAAWFPTLLLCSAAAAAAVRLLLGQVAKPWAGCYGN